VVAAPALDLQVRRPPSSYEDARAVLLVLCGVFLRRFVGVVSWWSCSPCSVRPFCGPRLAPTTAAPQTLPSYRNQIDRSTLRARRV